MRVLTFGNPHLPDDALAVQVARELVLPEVEFKISDDVNDLLEKDYDAILDVAHGIPQVVELFDLGKLREHKLVSLHDYDVAYFLKLMKAMGKLDDVRIIAIPVGYDFEMAKAEVRLLLQ